MSLQLCLNLEPDDRPTCSQLLKNDVFTADGFAATFTRQLRSIICKEYESNPLTAQTMRHRYQLVYFHKRPLHGYSYCIGIIRNCSKSHMAVHLHCHHFHHVSLVHSFTLNSEDLALWQILSTIDLFLTYRTDSTDSLPT